MKQIHALFQPQEVFLKLVFEHPVLQLYQFIFNIKTGIYAIINDWIQEQLPYMKLLLSNYVSSHIGINP